MTRDRIKEIYERFFLLGGSPNKREPDRFYRRKVTSMRLPGCFLLNDLVQSRKPKRVLDLGSGVTTIILRELQREYPDMMVVTTDTHRYWLDMTKREVDREGLNADYMFEQSWFEDMAPHVELFDLICVDIGSTDYRVALAPKIMQWCAPNGIIVCDDFRLRDFGARINVVFHQFGFDLIERPETVDEFGQTLGTAERTGLTHAP